MSSARWGAAAALRVAQLALRASSRAFSVSAYRFLIAARAAKRKILPPRALVNNCARARAREAARGGRENACSLSLHTPYMYMYILVDFLSLACAPPRLTEIPSSPLLHSRAYYIALRAASVYVCCSRRGSRAFAEFWGILFFKRGLFVRMIDGRVMMIEEKLIFANVCDLWGEWLLLVMLQVVLDCHRLMGPASSNGWIDIMCWGLFSGEVALVVFSICLLFWDGRGIWICLLGDFDKVMD